MKKLIFTSLIAFGLLIGSCNTNNQVRERNVQENDNKKEVRERYKNDTVELKRDKTIRYDDEGNIIKEVEKKSIDID